MKCQYCYKEFAYKNNKYRHQLKCKEKEVSHQVIHNQTNIQNQTNNNTYIGTQQININIFGKESLDHISHEFMMDCLKRLGGSHTGITNMVEKIHFSPEVPENRNVRLRSSKEKQLEIMDMRGWIIKDKNDVIGEMVFKIVQILNEYYKSDNGILLRNIEKEQGDPRYLKSLIDVVSINPQRHSNIYRQIYALIISYCRIMNN